MELIPVDLRPNPETVYLAADKILILQARTCPERPLARRILASPEAFLLTLCKALEGFTPEV